jgi:transcriptional regulator with XRE-family HTH domain
VRTAIDTGALRREIALRGLTQGELAAIAGLSEVTVSHAMAGRRIDSSTLGKLARALTVTPTLPGAERLIPPKLSPRTPPADGSADLARPGRPD